MTDLNRLMKSLRSAVQKSTAMRAQAASKYYIKKCTEEAGDCPPEEAEGACCCTDIGTGQSQPCFQTMEQNCPCVWLNGVSCDPDPCVNQPFVKKENLVMDEELQNPPGQSLDNQMM